MGKQVITETAKSQVVNRVIIGNDMGGSLWAVAVHDCATGKDHYYGLRDRDGKRKEDRFYDLVRESLDQGFTVDVFYSGCVLRSGKIWILAGTDFDVAGSESPYSADQQVEGDHVRESNKDR